MLAQNPHKEPEPVNPSELAFPASPSSCCRAVALDPAPQSLLSQWGNLCPLISNHLCNTPLCRDATLSTHSLKASERGSRCGLVRLWRSIGRLEDRGVVEQACLFQHSLDPKPSLSEMPFSDSSVPLATRRKRARYIEVFDILPILSILSNMFCYLWALCQRPSFSCAYSTISRFCSVYIFSMPSSRPITPCRTILAISKT